MADFRAGNWVHPSGGFRAGAVAYVALENNLAADAVAASSASGALVNWLSVTVASPNTGPGSIFDSRWWEGAAPANNDLIRYEDRNGFSVAPNGQYSATSAGSYLVQFAYASAPTVWYFTTVEIIQTDFAADAYAQASASGVLSGGAVDLAGSASAQADADGVLSGVPGAALAADAQGQAAAAGTLAGGVAPDTDPPVITLSGANPMQLIQGTPYSEPGYTAIDAVDGDVTGDVTVSGTVDHTTVNQYSLTYSVTDAAGNLGTRVRVVNVIAAATIFASSAPRGRVLRFH